MKKNIKLVATDLDGTCLNSQGIMSERTLKAFKKLADYNIKVVIASGRPLYQIRPIVEDLGLTAENDFSVGLNGAVVANNHNNNILYQDYIPVELMQDLAKDVLNENIDTLIMFDADNSNFDKMLLHCKGLNDDITKRYLSYFSKLSDDVVACIYDEKKHIKVSKVYLNGNLTEVNKIAAKWRSKVEITQEFHNDKSTLEITKLGTNKAWGIQQICQKYRIKPREVMVFGNEHNDLAMIKWAGIGVAVDNAPENIKNSAQVIAHTNDNDGVAKIIEEYVLNN